MRATFGQMGARALTSPYRTIASAYWFAAQALAGAFGVQAILSGLAGLELSLVPVAVAFAAVQAVLAAIGFDLLRYFVRVLLPLMAVFTGRARRAVRDRRRPRLRRFPGIRLARAVADLARLRDLPDRPLGDPAHRGDEYRRLLPLRALPPADVRRASSAGRSSAPSSPPGSAPTLRSRPAASTRSLPFPSSAATGRFSPSSSSPSSCRRLLSTS